jgi:DNA-binding NtrC family response regulator
MPILLPPLRLRTSDISLLARHFLAEMSREAHRVLDGFTPAAEKALTGYAWPGNVRELRNVIERAVLLADGPMVDESGLALGRFAINKPQAGSAYMFQLPPGGCDLAKVEEELVRQALDQCGGNQTQAAELLNITRDQVRYRLGKYGALTE